MSTLVLGIGNVLLTDEGIGVHALLELKKRYTFSDDVELLDGGTSGIELLRHIEDRDHLIIIDAMTADLPPGTVVRFAGEDVPTAFHTRISPHQLGLSDMLAAAMLTDDLPANLILFGVEPESIDVGLELTETAENSLAKLVEAVVQELRSLGCSVIPHDASITDRFYFWEASQAP